MSSSNNNQQETHPLFPSGEWEGFYKYTFTFLPKGEMSFLLHFENGIITGTGSDDVGAFSWRGTYDKEELRCQMTKKYGTHSVFYDGHVDENGIWGTWKLSDFTKGGFHIWPKKGGEEEEEEEVVAEEEVEPILEVQEMGTFAS